MATPKFSFTGWNSFKIGPQVPVPPPITSVGMTSQAISANGAGSGLATPGTLGSLVASTGAANTNLPGWLQEEVNKLNAQDALRKSLTNQVVGTGGGATAFDPNLGVAAVTAARAQYNTSLNQINEQARLQNLIQQRNQIRPAAFGFSNPLDIPRGIALDRQIEDYQRVNLPLAASAVSGSSGVRRNSGGWVSSPWM